MFHNVFLEGLAAFSFEKALDCEFCCAQLYGYERARLMCEWARKFVLRTSRLPTDEETCTSLASLMKEPLPLHVSTALPYMADRYPGGPEVPHAPFAGAADTTASAASKFNRNATASSDQPLKTLTALNPGSAVARVGPQGRDTASLQEESKGSLEQQGDAPGVSKKRKEPAKTCEGNIKVRKGGATHGSTLLKKSQAANGTPRVIAESPVLSSQRVEGGDVVAAAVSDNHRLTAPAECRESRPQQPLSTYLAFSGAEAGTANYSNGASISARPEPQDVPQAEISLSHGVESLGAPLRREDFPGSPEEAPRPGDLIQPVQEGNPWFEELQQLKKITRPKGGRAKRFNVGKKPFSGVRGIYFQQGLWKVKYRGDQEEAMKLFPYSPGVRPVSEGHIFEVGARTKFSSLTAK